MIDKKFEDKLKNLRELYIDKRPEVSQKLEDSKKFEAFMALSDEEKEEKHKNRQHTAALCRRGPSGHNRGTGLLGL